MKKPYLIGIVTVIVLCAIVLNIVPVLAQNDRYQIIERALSPGECLDTCNVPLGSAVYHLKNGVTKVYGPDKKLFLSAKDSEASLISTPYGSVSATRVHHVPSGSLIKTIDNVTKVYHDEVCILTVVNQSGSELPTPSFEGWIEQTRDLDVDGLCNFRAKWHCPSDPPTPSSDAINYIFNAIQPNDCSAIIPPVIEWNYANSGCWTGACWEVTLSDYYRSDPIDVVENDEIWGQMVRSNNTWRIYLSNYTGLEATSLQTWECDEQNDLMIFCALEGYNIDSDDDVPGDITFYDMIFKDSSNGDIDITWDTYIAQGTGLTGLGVTVYSDSSAKLNTAN